MRILITGSNGQVGDCLTHKLSNKVGITVLALDREELDITNRDSVVKLIGEFQPRVIINAAAYTAVDKAESDSDVCFAINRDGVKNLAIAAQKTGATLLHISTDYVFDGDKDGEYLENDSTNPQGVYGQSKFEGELAAQLCKKHIILRTAWVFGENGHNFVKTMLRLGTERDQLGVVSDQFGGPTYAGDIANALIHIAECIGRGEAIDYGTYHFSGLPHVSWYEFAKTIFGKAMEYNVLPQCPEVNAIPTSAYPTPAKRPANSKLDCGKIERTFGIKSSDWRSALDNIQAYR
ncbi:dTDP-4-dehydrorhamnose reductase [Vibrio rhodolitus]|uniref:dTDP-4-dehydrorhamnose reductase n=1 Tax=Vibrio rhodolitus TaxID=2231649 RepID=UPI000E0B5299|nr:dTDP-4-dehydrorhamnose reductase [Vibrio rhodolitus]